MNFNSITQISKKQNKCLDTFYITELIMKKHKELSLSDDCYVNFLHHQFIINIKRVSNLNIEIKKLCLCFLHDLLKKYINKDLYENDQFLMSIYNLDLNTYLLYELT